MSPLRKEALQLVESAPEEILLAVIHLIESERSKQLVRKKNREDAFNALENLLKLCKPVPPDFDEKKELAKYREEKFGNANLS